MTITDRVLAAKRAFFRDHQRRARICRVSPRLAADILMNAMLQDAPVGLARGEYGREVYGLDFYEDPTLEGDALVLE